MKLKSVRVTNFRSVLDSGEVEIAETTCLVGKNEAGKTAFLKALEGLKPVDDTSTYEVTRDYPRRDLSNYDRRHPDGSAQVIETTWTLSEDDYEILSDEFGADVLTGDEITVTRGYGSAKTWTVPIDENVVL